MKVFWFHKARLAFIKTAKYVAKEFGDRVAKDLFDEVGILNKYLADNPYMGKIEPLLADRSVEYHCLLVKRLNKIIYRIENDGVYVVDFWNLRQDPNKLQKRID